MEFYAIHSYAVKFSLTTETFMTFIVSRVQEAAPAFQEYCLIINPHKGMEGG